MQLRLVALCGLCLALAANAQVTVSSLTAEGGRVVDGMLAVTSGQPYVFTVRAGTGNLAACHAVWVVLENPSVFQPKSAGIVSQTAAALSFRAMVREGEEGLYDLYLCQDTAPTRSTPYQAKYRVVAPPKPSPTVDLEDEIQKAQQTARQALNRVAALEKQVKSLQGLNARTEAAEASLKKVEADLDAKAAKQQVDDLNNQVQVVVKRNEELGGTIQSVQSTLGQVQADLRGVTDRVQTDEGTIANNGQAIKQVQGRVEAVSEGVVNLANTLSYRKVASNILWFIPKRVLKRQQAEQVKVEVRRLAPVQAAEPAATPSAATSPTTPR